ncbi:hypothetical protein [Bacillus altitudinis]|uniref:hypothetical protein n=1 Tax=Bacillus altitudinis TaxID=293387 RepID=UPI00372CC236
MAFQHTLEEALENKISEEELKDIFMEFCIILTDETYSNADIGKRFREVFEKRVSEKYLK